MGCSGRHGPIYPSNLQRAAGVTPVSATFLLNQQLQVLTTGHGKHHELWHASILSYTHERRLIVNLRSLAFDQPG